MSWSQANEQAVFSKQDVAEEEEDMLCYAEFWVCLWVPSSPSSAGLRLHVSHVLKAMRILGSGPEKRGYWE